MSKTNRRILVMTSVDAERDAILRGINNDPRVDVVLAGVGPISASIQTTKALMSNTYNLVISAGIAGGFTHKTDTGSLVLSTEIVSADLGAESPEGFLSLDKLGFGSSTRIQPDRDLVAELSAAMIEANLPVVTAPILTLSTVTGTAETALELANREPDAAAEAMEGYGVAMAAKDFNLPVLEIRAISNAIGPRDRNSWRIKEALEVLQSASSILLEVL